MMGHIGWRLGLAAALGWLAWTISGPAWDFSRRLPLTMGAGVIAFLIAPYLVSPLKSWLKRRVEKIPAHVFLAGLAGLAIALGISALLALPLSLFPGPYGKVIPAIAFLIFCYLWIGVMVWRGRDILELVGVSLPALDSKGKGGRVLVDTSSIIDGRIADIWQAGFLPSPLLIPKFVLQELQYLADSNDSMRRRRGRRGLDLLNKLQKELGVPVEILDMDFGDIEGVDAKLVQLAKVLHCPIITQDFNLNRVAELQGVSVLNVNELATAVKSVVLPGEEMELHIIQEGKEYGQGVGFLEDGTMVVVEGGRQHINNKVGVVVTKVLQTTVGKMIFAQLKNGSQREK